MYNIMKTIFSFSKNLSDEEKKELKEYYKTYHRKLKILANSTSISFVSGGLISAVAKGGIALVAITSIALLIQSYMKHKDIDINIKTCQNTYKSYENLLNEIKKVQEAVFSTEKN